MIKEHQDYARAQFQKVPHDQLWHVWTVTIPRISITGRLVWGTVMRRRDDGRWIYKQYIENGGQILDYYLSAALRKIKDQ